MKSMKASIRVAAAALVLGLSVSTPSWAGQDEATALDQKVTARRWGNGLGPPSKQAGLATALLMARCARLAWMAGGRPSH
jgi:hypothetical protein